jgi:hypothetical protein
MWHFRVVPVWYPCGMLVNCVAPRMGPCTLNSAAMRSAHTRPRTLRRRSLTSVLA